MSDIQFTLTPREVGIVVDALEADLDDYLEDVKAAREENNLDEAATFSESADQIRALLFRIRELVPEAHSQT